MPGRTHRRRRAAVELLAAPGTAAPELHVTGSRQAAARARVVSSSPGRFGPDVWAWPALVERLWSCAGDGRAVFTVGARILAARRVLADPDVALPVEAAADLARLEHELDTHGRMLDGLDPVVRRAVTTLRSNLDSRRDHVRPAVAWRLLLRLLTAPPPALRSLLASHPTVWVDGLRWTSPLEAQLVVALLRAWSAAGARVALTLPTGRDRGGAEVASLLGGEPATATEHRSLRSTSELRAALVEALVATGEAEVLYAGGDGPVAFEPWTEPGPAGAGTVADTLLDGLPAEAPPSHVAVWRCPDPDTEARIVAEAVRRRLEEGAALSDCVVAAASGSSRLAAALRDAGVPCRDSPGPSLLAEPVAAAWCALAPTDGEATPADWRRSLLDAATRDELPGADAGPDRLRAWAACLEVVERLTLDLAAAADGPWPAGDLADVLGDAFARWRLETEGPGVDIVAPEALAEGTATHTFVCGLVRGAWPRGDAAPWLGSGLGADPRADATEILSAVLAEALDDPDRTVTLTWGAARDGAPVSPSVLLHTLPITAEDHVDAPSRGRTAGLRAAAADPAWDRVLPEVDRAALQLARADDAARRGPLGPHDGLLDRPPPIPAALGVTALETYVRCPARYWYTHVLRLDPVTPDAAELDPRRRGIAVHRILERMHRTGGLQPLSAGDAATLRRRLHDVAATVLDEIEAEGGFEPAFQAWARDRLLAGLVDDRPAGLLRVWLDGERASELPLVPVAVEHPFEGIVIGPTTLRGVLDRVDRLPDGTHLVVDYKTGAAPSRTAVEDGLALQPLAYTAAVAAWGHPVASVFLSLPRADAVRWTGWAGDPEALDRVCPPAQRRHAVVLDTEARAEGLRRLAAEADALARGVFPPTRHPPEVAGCPSCPYRTICRVDPTRHSATTPPPAL